MCGIIGYIGNQPCIEMLYTGLQKLAYRGYDSSGIAVMEPDTIRLVKSDGKLARLKPFLCELPQSATVGMGHTRWATHGPPSRENAHPHATDGLAIIHNGIVENYRQLKIKLLEEGDTFESDTDTEVVLHLLRNALKETNNNLRQSIFKIVQQLEGAYALGIVSKHEPDAIYIVKHGSPVAIGFGDGQNMFASDALPLIDYTKNIAFLDDGEIARIGQDSVSMWDFEGNEVHKNPVEIDWDAETTEKGGYRHFMLKEIHEQPTVVRRTIERLVNGTETKSPFNETELPLDSIQWEKVRRITMVACGTAYYAAQIGAYTLEPLWKMPITCELASEFRYRSPHLDNSTLIIAITQSGETLDTLASIKYAKNFGCQVLSICNVPHSSIPRESDATLYMSAGPEIGVASTKAFTSMVLNMLILGLARQHRIDGHVNESLKNTLNSLKALPAQLEQALTRENDIANLASRYTEGTNCLFIGRGHNCAMAFEGALKLKEISYIHAEGYAGGELKHGPIALIDRNMPVVAIVPRDQFREKMLSNLEEIRAREGQILAIGHPEDDALKRLAHMFIPCPATDHPGLQAILLAIPLQLFSYYVALLRGTDVDQPRNLAKSVTVE